MAGRKKPLVLSALRKGTLFKVDRDEAGLTVHGVYQIGTAKADHGQNVRVYDLAHLRKHGEAFAYQRTLSVPMASAVEIKVYRIPGCSRP